MENDETLYLYIFNVGNTQTVSNSNSFFFSVAKEKTKIEKGFDTELNSPITIRVLGEHLNSC